ncbi:hypothetical protein BH20ACT5_BH20ACT5_11030 [soil metagenome]
MGIVTISATFGAGGSEIGPAVAESLCLPFVDRAIPASVAHKLGVSLDDAEANDERVATGLWRVISSMALVPDLSAGPLAYHAVPDERVFREQTERVLREISQGMGGVILGRGGAFVLADVPDALHVRLDGPVEDRCRAHARFSGEDERTSRQAVADNDSARTAYVRHFYRCNPAEARHYHLVIDTTALPHNTVIGLIVTAARSRGIGCP